jgi:hypothetical protein
MAAAAAWWHREHTTAAYAGYRILSAIDGNGQLALAQLERELELPTGALQDDGLYARALATLLDQRLVQTDAAGSLAVTRTADQVLRPEDPDTIRTFTDALNTADPASAALPDGDDRRPDAFLRQPITYTHWAVFNDATRAADCAAAFNALPGWTATAEASPHVRDEWLLVANCQTPRAEFDTRHDQAQHIVHHHGAVADGGERTHAALTIAAHPAALAFPAAPRPSAAPAPETAASHIEPGLPTVAQRHTR